MNDDDGYIDHQVDQEMDEVAAALLEDDIANQRLLNAQILAPNSNHQQYPFKNTSRFHQVG